MKINQIIKTLKYKHIKSIKYFNINTSKRKIHNQQNSLNVTQKNAKKNLIEFLIHF